MDKLIITAAVNGGITTRAKNPAVPYSPAEIAQAVFDCWNAGASVAHIHARDEQGKPSYQAQVWGEIAERVREKCDILLNFSTSGLNLPPHLPKCEAWNHLVYRPEITSYNCGSVNHGDKPFINPPALARELATAINAAGSKPEIEVYHAGIINEARRLVAEGYLQGPLLFSFALGIPGGTEASVKNLLHLVESIPQGSQWSALALGKDQLPTNLQTLLLGGHIRTGFEDNVYYRYRELASSNARFVERLTRYSRDFGREIASPAQARAMLGIDTLTAGKDSKLRSQAKPAQAMPVAV